MKKSALTDRHIFLGAVVITFMLFAGPGLGYAATTNYVWTNSPSPAFPYIDWDHAAHTMQQAVAVAVTSADNTVLVTNGVYDTGGEITPGYALTNRVLVTNAITVRSVNGPSVTIIKGNPASNGSHGDDAVRCVYLDGGASLIGFTLTNGYTMTNGIEDIDRSCGGVYLRQTDVVSNCIVSGNNAQRYAGGVYISGVGTLNNCIILQNTVGRGGGGVYMTGAGSINNCTLSSNTAVIGGGLIFSGNGTVNNCKLTWNISSAGGGGASYWGSGNAKMNNCEVSGNTSLDGGGLYIDSDTITLNNCTVSGNTASRNWGGVIIKATATISNCVIWGNISASDSNVYITAGTPLINYTCSGPAQSGTGNIGSDPQFTVLPGGNYRLRMSSPCVNTGSNQDWMTNAVDLGGNARILNGTVDMGAYERLLWQGVIFSVH